MTNTEAEHCRRAVLAWVSGHGFWSPGDETHPAHSSHDFSADHLAPAFSGRPPPGPGRILCRRANSRLGKRGGDAGEERKNAG